MPPPLLELVWLPWEEERQRGWVRVRGLPWWPGGAERQVGGCVWEVGLTGACHTSIWP